MIFQEVEDELGEKEESGGNEENLNQ